MWTSSSLVSIVWRKTPICFCVICRKSLVSDVEEMCEGFRLYLAIQMYLVTMAECIPGVYLLQDDFGELLARLEKSEQERLQV